VGGDLDAIRDAKEYSVGATAFGRRRDS